MASGYLGQPRLTDVRGHNNSNRVLLHLLNSLYWLRSIGCLWGGGGAVLVGRFHWGVGFAISTGLGGT